MEVTFKSFYPFITWGLINKAIEFAKTIVDVPDEDINYHAVTKNLIVLRKSTMGKKGKRQNFDVAMGCYNREVSEIIASYTLNSLSNILDKALVGLYRDNGLAIVRNLSGPEIESKRKAIITHFKECGLNITLQTNLKIVNFLDVKMKIDTGRYHPYRKPDMSVYINRKSNHPPTLIKEVPREIAKQISDISSNEVVFNESIPIYLDTLRKGFQ